MPRGTAARAKAAATKENEPVSETETTEAATKTAEPENVFEWAEPPAAPEQTRRGRGVSDYWQKVADALKTNTGQWAKVAEHSGETGKNKASNFATRIRTGSSRAFEKDMYEVAPRELPSGGWGVFARHTGGSHLPVVNETGNPSTDAAIADGDNTAANESNE